jgi:hypothetical protein
VPQTFKLYDMKKTLLSFIMLTSIGIYSAHAQITINFTDVVGPGDVVEQAQDTMPSMGIGGGGASQTWNFAALNQHSLDTLRFKNPSGLPGATNFPLSNVAMTDTKEDSTWMYLSKISTGLYVNGMAQYQQGNLLTFPFVTTIITFPSTMGTNYSGSWNGTVFGMDLSAFPLGIDSIKITRQSDLNSNIDGWGNVTTPFGTFPSLRQIVIEETIDTTWELVVGNWSIISPTTIATLGLFNVTVTDIEYDTTRQARWWTDDPSSKFPIVEMSYDAQGSVHSASWQKSSPSVGVAPVVDDITGTNLYPNPARNEITIETNLDNNSVSILDVTGKVISTHRFVTDKIRLSVEDLEGGIYFYKIYDVNGNVIHANRFIVAK